MRSMVTETSAVAKSTFQFCSRLHVLSTTCKWSDNRHVAALSFLALMPNVCAIFMVDFMKRFSICKTVNVTRKKTSSFVLILPFDSVGTFALIFTWELWNGNDCVATNFIRNVFPAQCGASQEPKVLAHFSCRILTHNNE